jgi:hypothetical protein
MDARRQRGGDADELVIQARAIDRAAVTRDDVESGAVIAPEHPMSPPTSIRPTATQPGSSRKASAKISAAASNSARSRGRTSTRGIFSYRMLPPREQGDFGERAALHWLIGQGAQVAIPFGHSPNYDLVADFAGHLSRVQVKTSAYRYKGRWAVTVCTRGGNQSWGGLVKRLSPDSFDHLFVLVADGRQWFIPASRVEGGTAIHLGGPKYREFEVESGDPIPAVRVLGPPLQSSSA